VEVENVVDFLAGYALPLLLLNQSENAYRILVMATWEILYNNVTPKPVRYTRAIISYLDILGFRELIETRSAGEISQILRILAESVEPGSIFKNEKIQFTKFSDTVIRSMPESRHYPRNFLFELRSILHSQIALIPRGITVRGAVTIGDIVQSWKVVYGRGVVRAYELESRKDSPPRIVIDNDALSSVRPAIEGNNLAKELDELIRTEDSVTYLDYLRATENELNVPEQEYSIFLKHHRDLIRAGLAKYAGRPSILRKYEWLESYHQRTLLDRFGREIPAHLQV
jgi:hypothetical protein